MKAVVTAGQLQMIIESPNIDTRPTIKGDLWELFRGLDLEAWLLLYKQPEVNRYIEIDFALALTKDKFLNVEFIEPIEGYESTKDYIV
jgi:hypothetical protein